VKRLLAGLMLGAVLAGIALIVALVVAPERRPLELDIFVLVVGALTVLTAALAARGSFPVGEGSAIAEALVLEPRLPVRPPELERTERLLTIATTTAFDLHFRLRPVLREVAGQRLADRQGLRLDSGDPRVLEALGDELWELVRPDRPPPARRFAPGLPPAALRRAIERLEALA
jgi:hypothetical protein